MEKEVTKTPKSAAVPGRSGPENGEVRADGKPTGVRYASAEQFKKAHKKTSTLHAGLFRRLAQ